MMEVGKARRYGLVRVMVLMGVLLLLCVWGMVQGNEVRQRIHAEGAVVDMTHVEFGTWPYLISGEWTIYDGLHDPQALAGLQGKLTEIGEDNIRQASTYVLEVKGARELVLCPTLAIAGMWVNGERVVGASGERLGNIDEVHLAYYADGTDAYTIVVQYDNTRRGLYGLLAGTKAQMNMMRQTWTLSDLLTIGCTIMLIAVCLVLYLQKRSEKYVLLLCLVCMMQLLKRFVYPRSDLLLQMTVPGIFFLDIWGLLRYLLLFYFSDKTLWKRCAPLVALCAGGWIAGYAANVFMLQNVCYVTYVMIEGLILCRGYDARIQGCGILLTGWLVNAVNEVFYLLLNSGVISQGFWDIFVRPMPYVSLLYVFAFAAATLGVFARKFRLADDLTMRLEQRVQEQMKDVLEANTHLRQTQQQKHDMMTNIAHNLKNPIFALHGYIDILEKDDSMEGVSREAIFGRIYGKIADINSLVEDVLLLARFEDKRVQLRYVTFSPAELLQHAVSDAGMKGMRRRVHVSLNLQDIPQEMVGDGFRIRQAMDNILDNAVRHSADGGQIAVTAKKHDAQHVRICIEDHGSGIRSADMTSLFERYDAKGSGGVTGLGLAITKEIIDAHGGRIELQSRENMGTKVTIVLPVEQKDA